MSLNVKSFFHDQSNTWTHVVDGGKGECIVIDPAADIDVNAMRISYDSAREVVSHIRDKGLQLKWVLETHPHADHATAAPFILSELGGKIAIGEGVSKVQEMWNDIYNLPPEQHFTTDVYDRLIREGETLEAKGISLKAISTPGHTPSCMTYVADGVAFLSDTLFYPDYGTARCDFPGGSAKTLYASIQKILSLPPETELYLAHDYLKDDRKEYKSHVTVAEQKAKNIHVRDGISEEEFIEFRTKRDATLPFPKALLLVLQVNLRAGEFPEPEVGDRRFLKVPLNRF